MKLVRYNPAEDYVPTSWNSILNSFFNDNANTDRETKFRPVVDIAENEHAYEIHLSAPGMAKEDFTIDLKDRNLIISGERKWKEEHKDKNFHRIESQYGSFTRSFTLPEDVNAEAISASYKEGILEIDIPKDVKKALKTTIKIK